MVSWTIFIVYMAGSIVISICRPDAITKNDFMGKFVGADLLNVLAVIMTITFASIANIHLTVSRVIAAAFRENPSLGQEKAAGLRRELNTNAWLMFAGFIWAAIFSAVRAIPKITDTLIAFSDTMAIAALVVHMLVFRDIYSTLFGLSASDLAIRGEINEDLDTK
jgi:hypothetical protein